MIDVTTLDDEQFAALARDVTDEENRRLRLANAPMSITDLTRRFVEDGGDPEEIRAALTETLPEPAA